MKDKFKEAVDKANKEKQRTGKKQYVIRNIETGSCRVTEHGVENPFKDKIEYIKW